MTDFQSLFRCFAVELDAAAASLDIPVCFDLRPPAEPAVVRKHELRMTCGFPVMLRDYYAASNGTSFGTFAILSLDDLQCIDGLICIQDWGNGDSTCVVSDDRHLGSVPWASPGTICFMNHRSTDIAYICETFIELILGVKAEYFATGDVAHPADYILGHAQFAAGIYRRVIPELLRRDSEFRSRLG